MGNNDPTPIMVSLQKRLDDRSNDDREYQFFLHVLQYLIAFLGFEVEVESWMITSHEVELGHRIGVGGLYVLFYAESGILSQRAYVAAGKSTKAFGTRQMLRSRFSGPNVVSRQAQRLVLKP